MKRKRDGFVPLGDVRRRYRYGRVARRLRPPPPPAPRPFTRIRFRECFGQVQLRLAACARAYTTSHGLQEKPALGERSTSRSLR